MQTKPTTPEAILTAHLHKQAHTELLKQAAQQINIGCEERLRSFTLEIYKNHHEYLYALLAAEDDAARQAAQEFVETWCASNESRGYALACKDGSVRIDLVKNYGSRCFIRAEVLLRADRLPADDDELPFS